MGLADVLIESALENLFEYVFNRPKPRTLPQKVEILIGHLKTLPEEISMKWLIHRDIVMVHEKNKITACSIEYRVRIGNTSASSAGLYVFLSPLHIILADLAKTGYGTIDRFYCTNSWQTPMGNEKEALQKTYEAIADAYLKKLMQEKRK